MRPASLFIVFVAAKAAILWDRPVDLSLWSTAAYLWQDAMVVVVFAAAAVSLDRLRPQSHIPAFVYWCLAAYAALNIPIARVLSTPLTMPMLRATSDTLADSILLYATWLNAALVLTALGMAAILPRVLSGLSVRALTAAIAAAALLVAIGPAAADRVDTIGLHRNAVVALVLSAFPRVDARAAGTEDWTAPFSALAAVESADLAHTPNAAGDKDTASANALQSLRGIARGRNVILVGLESTGAQYLRLYGAAEDLTPNLDRLAQSGVVFDHAYAVYPESIKGLFSVLCSTFPAFDTTPRMYEAAPCRSIAAELSARGYVTAMFHSGRFGYLGMESIIRGRGYHTLADAGDIGGQRESSFGVDEDATVARMLDWIDSHQRSRPFFLTYLPIAGHHPYETPAPGPYPTGEEIGRYRNALHYGDQALGRLMDGVHARGLDRDTVWIVIGDHGEAFGQHHGNYGHTFFLYDENVRVPFVISVPGALDGMRRSRSTVSLVDTAPSILDLLGLPVPEAHQGHSVLDARPRMALFFTDYSLGLVGLRDGRWKFIHELESGRSKLFDLESDPGEGADVSAGHISRVTEYVRRLRDWSASQKRNLTDPDRIPTRRTGIPRIRNHCVTLAYPTRPGASNGTESSTRCRRCRALRFAANHLRSRTPIPGPDRW